METGISDKELVQIREQMLKFATLQVGNAVLAEDLVQESFLSAFNHLEQFKRQSAFKTWVFAILKNKIIDFLRQKGKFVLETEMEDEALSGIQQKGFVTTGTCRIVAKPFNFVQKILSILHYLRSVSSHST